MSCWIEFCFALRFNNLDFIQTKHSLNSRQIFFNTLNYLYVNRKYKIVQPEIAELFFSEYFFYRFIRIVTRL